MEGHDGRAAPGPAGFVRQAPDRGPAVAPSERPGAGPQAALAEPGEAVEPARPRHGTWALKTGLARMLKGGVIMDVTTPEEARIAEEAGAVAVMALERVPADIRAAGGVARMADPDRIRAIMAAVTIPVMAKCRIGHFVEAQILEALGVDFIDESEVLTPADERFHIDKHAFQVPFVCGARDLGEALRRIAEGAAMIRTKGEPGTGDVVEAVRHMRRMNEQIRQVCRAGEEELVALARDLGAPYELLLEVRRQGRLPVVNFAAGGIATPADAALMMQLGADGVFVGSGIFKSANPAARARAIVEAVAHYDDPERLARVSGGLGEAMAGVAAHTLADEERMQRRGG
ncbi:pyridoxal 5'-phosphate synthase lyase subunit PdxS [Thermaerobacter litoralis]